VSEPLRLRVVTFNIHGGRPRIGQADLKATAAVLAELEADLIALQEVHHYMPPPYVWQDQPARLRKLLRMHVAFRRSFGLGPSAYGNAILSRVRPERVRRVRLPAGYEPRTLLEAEFAGDGRRFRFLNTHLGLRREERAEQLAVLAKEARRCGLPVILAGDLNAGPEAPEMAVLEQAGLRHCLDPDRATFPCDAPQCRLDYLMVSRHFEVEACRVVETEVSDHLPLAADVVLWDE
jgi:endonuclease/exonuclease/phosphatase family metal-dependent hydrolase